MISKESFIETDTGQTRHLWDFRSVFKTLLDWKQMRRLRQTSVPAQKDLPLLF